MTKSFLPNLQSGVYKITFWALLALLLSGCTGWIKPEQSSIEGTVPLSAGNTVGQTFVAKYDGLSGVYFYLSPSQISGNGKISLHVRIDPQADKDLAVSENVIPVDQIHDSGYYGFLIPSLPASNQKYFYAFLELSGSGLVQVGKAGGNTYLNGSLYQNGDPQDAQAAFQLIYSRRMAFLGLGLESLTWVGITLIAIFLFIIPGWAIFSILWPTWSRLTWPEKSGLSAGLSLALYPLLLLWTGLIGLHLGAVYAWLPPLAGMGIILWRNREKFHIAYFREFFSIRLKQILRLKFSDITLLVILAFIIFTRFWAIRSLDLPMWGDFTSIL